MREPYLHSTIRLMASCITLIFYISLMLESIRRLTGKKELKIASFLLLSIRVMINIYRSVISPVFLYGFETWSIAIREEIFIPSRGVETM